VREQFSFYRIGNLGFSGAKGGKNMMQQPQISAAPGTFWRPLPSNTTRRDIGANKLGECGMDDSDTGLADAYQLAAHEIQRIQRLPWEDLAPRENAPWVFGTRELAHFTQARGGLTIVDEFDGNPCLKQVTVALEWEHNRQGRRAVRLVTLVNRAEKAKKS
jgi:hypothetical protein